MTLDDLLRTVDSDRLSASLTKALRLAKGAGNDELSSWCRLELGGYWQSNSAMNEEVVVPEYRGVAGQHYDLYGRLFVPPANLAFVNETRLRNGIEELETLSETRDVVSIHDPTMCNLIKEDLQVEVYAFRFSAVHLKGILADIRRELVDRLGKSQESFGSGVEELSTKDDEILELRPNLWGIGINIRALWRKWKGQDGEA